MIIQIPPQHKKLQDLYVTLMFFIVLETNFKKYFTLTFVNTPFQLNSSDILWKNKGLGETNRFEGLRLTM